MWLKLVKKKNKCLSFTVFKNLALKKTDSRSAPPVKKKVSVLGAETNQINSRRCSEIGAWKKKNTEIIYDYSVKSKTLLRSKKKKKSWIKDLFKLKLNNRVIVEKAFFHILIVELHKISHHPAEYTKQGNSHTVTVYWLFNYFKYEIIITPRVVI